MTRWQYAWMTDQPQTTIGFSHPQPGLASELAAVLGPGVLLQQSTEWLISLDRMRVNLGYVSGLMGDRGWEMFEVETRLQPGAMSPAQLQTNWYFKRPAPDVPMTQPVVSAAAATAPTTSYTPQAEPGGVGFASVNPAPAGPQPSSGPAMPPPPGPTGS